jgi:hypothetical protein
MKKYYLLITLLGIIYILLDLSTLVFPEFICKLFMVLLYIIMPILLVVALVNGFTIWRHSSRMWPMPALLALTIIIFAFCINPYIAQSITDRLFEHHLADYTSIVDGFKKGTIHCTTSCEASVTSVDTTNMPSKVRDIWAGIATTTASS